MPDRAVGASNTFSSRGSGTVSRRAFLGTLGATTALAASGCSSGLKGSSSGGSDKTIKIGYVSPKTGALSVLSESDAYVISRIKAAVSKGLSIGGTTYHVNVVTKDTQSSAARAAEVASELIQQDAVDIVLCTSTPDTVNPVSDQCEAAGVPCIATICPWEMWFYKRGGSATKPFTYTYLYFIGAQEEAELYGRLWQGVKTNKVVGGLWPNDVDGEIFRQYVGQKVGSLDGFTMVASGAYQDGTQDFTSIISNFKKNNVEILHAAPIPPDWVTFWRQAKQNGFAPKLVCVSKALLIPSVAASLGPLAHDLVSPIWWAPSFPFRSSLDGASAQVVADGYKTSTGRQWTQPMGFNHAIFEIAIAALKASGNPKDRKAVAAAIGRQKGEVITGTYDFTSGPVKNVAIAPDFIGQWRKDTAGTFTDLVVVDNSMNAKVPAPGSLELLC